MERATGEVEKGWGDWGKEKEEEEMAKGAREETAGSCPRGVGAKVGWVEAMARVVVAEARAGRAVVVGRPAARSSQGLGVMAVAEAGTGGTAATPEHSRCYTWNRTSLPW